MRDWLCKIICRDRSTVRENNDTDRKWDIEARVRDLRRRIAQLRARIGQSTDDTSAQRVFAPEEEPLQRQSVDERGSASRPSQADDLKAKLLGKKQ